MGTLTNSDGRFLLLLDRAVDPATTQELPLQVALLGYGTEERTIEVAGNQLVLGDVGMATTALAMDELVVTGTAPQDEEADPSAPVRVPGIDGEGWQSASLAGADGATRFPVRIVPDLAVTSVHVGTFDGTTVVRVVQELQDGGALVVLQSARRMLVEGEGGATTVSLTRDDGAFVVGRAERSPDSIRALLERIR